MEISTLQTTAPLGQQGQPQSASTEQRGVGSLTSDDFFELLVAQLTNQDPLNPTSNEEILQQISSIRDIEMSVSLTQSIKSLAHQQRVGSASALIGQYVEAEIADPSGQAARSFGVVVGVQFGADGEPVLLLGNGDQAPIASLSHVTSQRQAAEQLLGREVAGVSLDGSGDGDNGDNPEVIQGIVSGIQDDNNEVTLELDNGESLPLRNVVQVLS